jgi:hypothetical protein
MLLSQYFTRFIFVDHLGIIWRSSHIRRMEIIRKGTRRMGQERRGRRRKVVVVG